MARGNPKPTEKTNWIPDDTSNIVAPSVGRKLVGWLFNIKPPAEIFNWAWNLKSRFEDYHSAQVEDWIVIDSDADEGDYATLVAYLADAPAAGDRVLVKEDQTITAQMVWPDAITVKFLDGTSLLCATNIATSVLQPNNNIIIEGVLNIILSHTGVTAKAVEYNGNNITGKINVINASTGTVTTMHHINAAKENSQVTGLVIDTGGGSFTNAIVDNSVSDSNDIVLRNGTNSVIARSRGSYKFKNGLEFDLSSDADGDVYYRDAGVLKRLPKGTDGQLLELSSGIPSWQSMDDTLHGNRGGGALHSLAIAGGANGFLSGSDKTKLDESTDGETTPTLTGIDNVSSSSTTQIQYQRQGDTVVGVLFADVTPTVAATFTRFRLVLPIASNFTLALNATGAGGASAGGASSLITAMCEADPTNDELRVFFYSINTNSHNIRVPFSYKII